MLMLSLSYLTILNSQLDLQLPNGIVHIIDRAAIPVIGFWQALTQAFFKHWIAPERPSRVVQELSHCNVGINYGSEKLLEVFREQNRLVTYGMKEADELRAKRLHLGVEGQLHGPTVSST